MAKRKTPSEVATTRAGKTLRSKRASKLSKSLAGAVLRLDPKKGQAKKPRREK
jgi:hypothetical protein